MTRSLTFGSVCSGIEAASVAWHPLGWRAAFLSEIEPFPCALLAHHYPETPNRGDMTGFKEWPDAAIDVLVGGTPCQPFSVAGLRKGLADPRGNLMLTYGAIARKYRPRWLVWENVPGVLSSAGGRDFGTFLGMLAELGYGFAYRVLDAQYFGVAQRRRRVFVVGRFGDWRRAGAVLSERASMRGDSAPSREAREGIAQGVTSGTLRSRHNFNTTEDACGGNLIAGCLNSVGGNAVPGNSVQDADQGYLQVVEASPVSLCLNAGGMGRMDAESETLLPIGGYFDVAHALRADGFDASEDGTGRGTPLVPVAFAENSRAEVRLENGDGSRTGALSAGGGKAGQGVPMVLGFGHQEDRNFKATEESVSAITRNQGLSVAQASSVRRLTPRECERLQGFPDDYTLIPYRGKYAADGPRYKALGNSMAVPVMRWIGERIAVVDLIQ